MRTTRVAVVLVLMVFLAGGAGLIAGKLSSRPAAASVVTPQRATLSDELQLTPEQRTTMKAIWEAARDAATQCAADAQKLQRQYDDAVVELLTPEQKVHYKELTDQTKEKVKALDARREAAFSQAVERTNKILSEPQRKIYQQVIQSRLGASGAEPGVGRVPEDGPTPPATR